jgi:hypothetical protein
MKHLFEKNEFVRYHDLRWKVIYVDNFGFTLWRKDRLGVDTFNLKWNEVE